MENNTDLDRIVQHRQHSEVATMPVMQAKDIPDIPVLIFVAMVQSTDKWLGATALIGFKNSVQNSMPSGVNGKLARAKMKTLIRRGLVDGCACDCRGDFTLTAKGRKMVESTAVSSPIVKPAPSNGANW